MSYNYLLNTFDGSIGCELKTSEITTSTGIYNGKIKNETNQSSGFRTLSNCKNQIKLNNLGNFNINDSPDSNIDDKKLKFSEKLKVLLNNGGSKSDKIDLPDPYTFSDIEQLNGPLSKALSNVEAYIGKSTSTNIKASNGTTQKSIMFPRSLSPQTTKNNSVEEKDCNDESKSNCKKNLKLAKFAVPMFATNNFVSTTDLSQPSYKMQPNNHSENNKMSGLKNGKTTHVQLPSSNKPLLNKLFGKAKLQNVKPSNVINTLKTNRCTSGKPSDFGQPQGYKLGNPKIEKKLDNKHKNFQKGKSLLNQLQKTALLNRTSSHQIRKNSPKSSFFGMNKNIQRQTDGPLMVQSSIKNLNKKSLLEESLLGM